ncbi:MAG: efflux RND transporter periplasmic adaptor subunit [Amphritea sp.]|nr:efflux RND transporter periplasmic adaptor subunit [Amphritea sp.]
MTSEVLAEVSLEGDLSPRSSQSAEPISAEMESMSQPVPFSPSPETYQRWLNWQCQMIAGNLQGHIFTPDASVKGLVSVVQWPGKEQADKALVRRCDQALREAAPVIQAFQPTADRSERVCDLIAIPLISERKIHAVVGLVLTPRSQAQRTAVIQLIQWGGVWLDSLNATESSGSESDQALLTALLEHTTLENMAAELARRMAIRFDCQRVSVGYCEGYNISQLASTSNDIHSLTAVMTEAADQQEVICSPPLSGKAESVSFAHQQYHDLSGRAICSVPLIHSENCIALITLERGRAFSATELDQMLACCHGVAAIMALIQQGSQTLLQHGTARIRNLFSAPESGLKKGCWFIVGIICLSALLWISPQYRVSAPASIQAYDRQFLVAPYDGYIRTLEARVGDRVVAGQTLMFLDDRELRLQQQKWQSEKLKLEREYQDALARGERTKLSILRARIDQVIAETDLVAESIRRARLTAPFDGVLVSGDVDHSPGTAIAIGEPLFEVAPMDRYRIILEVSEDRMKGIAAGHQGELVFTALPDTPFRFQVERVLPAARVSDTGSFFRVEATLAEPAGHSDGLLRPGMQGVAKIEMGKRSLLWILSHRLADRIRLWLWSLGG